MTRHFGRISLLVSVASWGAFLAILFFGGLDPTPALAQYLRSATMGTLLSVLVSGCLAAIALVRGPQRVSAGVALVLCLLYGLVFTGAIYALLSWL